MKRKNFIVIAASISLMMFFGCGNKPKDKLKIEGKTYSISLGDIKFDADNGFLSVAVLTDGQPLQNKPEHRRSSISMDDGQKVISSVSSSQPVKMAIEIKGRRIFAHNGLSSENGIFTFEVEEIPDIIEVSTDMMKEKTKVYFNAKTKELMSSKEIDLYAQEWIRINNKARLNN